MERKFVIIETLEDDGTTTEEVVEVFELIDENDLLTLKKQLGQLIISL